MSKINRIRNILESNTRVLLPIEYDAALLGIYYNDMDMHPVYSYLCLVEAHMKHTNETEEQSVEYLEDNIISHTPFIIVDDTGV